MSVSEPIVRIAAKGDGITPSGRHVPLAAPGDVVLPDGSVEAGPHHATPPCRHFGKCGGCQLQHVDDVALASFVRDRVLYAARSQELEPEILGETHLSPPRSRRRASLHAQPLGAKVAIGFREAGSHRIVDLAECHVLRPELFALVAPLRRLLGHQRGRWSVDVELTLADQGVDCGIRGFAMEGLEATEAALAFAQDNGLARLTIDMGYGAQAVWEPQPLTVTLGRTPVALPPGAFLQATADGEAALVAAAREWLAGADPVADLFAGLGTFAFALDAPVSAFEAARDAHLACRAAAARGKLPVEAHHRDLFRNPLQSNELDRFAGVLLDPPRAGAREQAARIAESAVERVVYVSCNPASWAKDARTLADAGFRLAELRPVGQFRWSTHVELASLFVR
ncbi:23S rRNA (uracil(1939)-C(5))-methyltransferase RlmD [Tsuneonella dongtanensis]|uniref:23S rRNA (Uracil(1939)-C(5))-methyltransferase RlmD n=1 Tax=Tsuneonella dongtanensis TaxID=692370 RepID=A0A1B2AF52_9SPHN|nr:class I SAM-dependent RNA methyltransferase [Tsuneonella dongtanensis]ANY20789.1 23S rRNA (uracil(1939)-C(5))-methyltransferase RlmD [Tsuneonella dongtanensis]